MIKKDKEQQAKEIESLRLKLDASSKVENNVIEELERKLRAVDLKYEDSNKFRDMDIMSLQRRLDVALQNANPDAVKSNMEIQRLQSIITKKDSEIFGLKETVRVGCEERMGLVSSVANLQTKAVVVLPQQTKTSPKSLPIHNNKPLGTKRENRLFKAIGQFKPARVEMKFSTKDAEFFQLFKDSTLKNSKRSVKQSRPSLGI